MRTTDAAVIGRLTEVTPVGDASRSDYVYELLDVFKGRRRLEPGRRLAVRASKDEAGCGLPSTLGRRLGVFLERSGGRWTSNLCIVVSPREMRKAGSDRGAGSRVGWSCR